MSNSLRRVLPVAVLAMILGAVAVFWKPPAQQAQNAPPTFRVASGPLHITVVESGTIKARDQVIISSEIEGKSSILYLIPEGTRVSKGDLLVELDVSQLVESRIDQEILVNNAEAAFIGAREDLAVVENQAKSDVDQAQLNVVFAKNDQEKYLKGEYPNELKALEAALTLAKEDLERAEDRYNWSKKLANEQFLSEAELLADQLAMNKKRLDVELAESNLELSKDYTYKRRVMELESQVSQTEMALERAERKASADVVQGKAKLEASRSEYERQKDKLAKLDQEIKKGKIYAPRDGLVIHATSTQSGGWRSRVEPLAEGKEVIERQELIHLPTSDRANAEILLHETSLRKVKLGMASTVTVDALKGTELTGHVESIAPLPDSQSAFLNPDLKLYPTVIFLDSSHPELRTGMSCQAEILIADYQSALYVPVQAVIKVRGESTVFVVSESGLEPRQVKVGLDNGRMVHILSGVQAGEEVSLTPPLKEASVSEKRRGRG